MLKIKNQATSITNFLFPKSCIHCNRFSGNNLCTLCIENHIFMETNPICISCKRPLENTSVHKLCNYPDGISEIYAITKYNFLIRKIIKDIKYNLYYDYTDILSRISIFSLLNILKIDLTNSILVPIPLHRFQKWKRGFNQSEVYADRLGYSLEKFNLHIPVVKLLQKNSPTVSQKTLNKVSRQKNLLHSFEVCSRDNPHYKDSNIILIDDIVTTGSTLTAASRELRSSGFKNIRSIVFARA